MKAPIFAVLILVVITASTIAQEAFVGNTLISLRNTNETFLMDIDFNIIKTWHGANFPSEIAYMLPDGSILRPTWDEDLQWGIGGRGGRIQKIDTNDNVVWDFLCSDSLFLQHHDIEPMPNGNVLVIAWERKSEEDAIAFGRQDIPAGEIWPTAIFEYEQTGPTSAAIVWEWHLWDHLIQDADSTKENYGVLADHPELVDINHPPARNASFDHANAVGYNPQLDQIVFSARAMSEIYVIDHSTTSAEAAGHTGGNSGKGGDILYRWGNPLAYNRGSASDRHVFSIHGGVWIDCGLPGEGGLLIFNNGFRPGPAPDYSTVIEIFPPRDADGNYYIAPGEPFGPSAPLWEYEDRPAFFSRNKGGAYRMPNGNTLITESNDNKIFEVTPAGQKVWVYSSPEEVHRAPRYWTSPQTLVADLDIHPGSCPNPFNTKWLKNLDDGNGNDAAKLKKGGVMPAAIVGGLCFDVSNVDLSTLLLQGVPPLKSSYEDITQPAGGGECACTTDGPDGYVDLTLKFSRQDIAAVLGNVANGDVVTLTLTGSLLDGTPFEAADCVTVLAKDPEPFTESNQVVLYPAVPNPFNPETTIRYELKERGHVSLAVYNVAGKLVRTLVDEVKPPLAGGYSVAWDGRTNAGNPVPSGVYFYRLVTQNFMQTRKMILLK
ncbi:MAG: aryl-sulfate sulfotransferase [Candidatus Krumholzibacteria bacterium]|nr:aryl-sulfate sulfotransferase [Candidatus Krumholzibacteria bacterium]